MVHLDFVVFSGFFLSCLIIFVVVVVFVVLVVLVVVFELSLVDLSLESSPDFESSVELSVESSVEFASSVPLVSSLVELSSPVLLETSEVKRFDPL